MLQSLQVRMMREKNRKDFIWIDFVIKITKEDKTIIDNLEKA
jgi:hypothetical protein